MTSPSGPGYSFLKTQRIYSQALKIHNWSPVFMCVGDHSLFFLLFSYVFSFISNGYTSQREHMDRLCDTDEPMKLTTEDF